MKYPEIIRQAYEFSDIAKPHRYEGDTIAVVSAQKWEVFPELYAKAALVLPMHVLLRPGHSGVTSSSFFVEFIDPTSGNLFVRIQRQHVTIDAVTRKPIPVQHIPVEDNDIPNPAQPVIIPRFTPPSDTKRYIFKVYHSDSDDLYHVNHATYVRLCSDTAANACNDGKLKNFSGDFYRYEVSGALMRYLGESFPGDDLEVTVWEDPVDHDSLYFHISRLKKPIFAAKFTYFKPTVSKL